MHRLTARKLLSYSFLAAVVYLLLTFLLPSALLVQILNGIFVGLVVAVTIVFFPLVWRAITQRAFDDVAQLTIGICLTWASLVISRSTNIFGQVTNTGGGLANSAPVAFATYLAILGAVLHITAPGMVESKLVYNRGILAFALAVGVVLSCLTILVQGV